MSGCEKNKTTLSKKNHATGAKSISGAVAESLRESEQRYRTLFENAAEGIVVADEMTKTFLYVNPAICEFLGYSQTELTSMTVYDIHPKKYLSHVLADFEAQARGEKTLAADIPCLCKDGSVKYAHINSRRVVMNSKECMVGFFTDVTELRNSQQALAKSEKRLRLILEHSWDGINIAEFDLDICKRRLVFCNDRYVEMAGRSREELLAADDLNNFMRYTTSPQTRNKWRQNIVNQTPYKGRACWIRPDGRENYYEFTAVSVKVEGRYQIVGINRDVTSQIKAQEKLEKAEAQYRTLVEQIPAVIYTAVLDEASTTIFVSPQVEKLLGLTPQQYAQDPDIWRKQIHPEDWQRVMDEVAAVHEKGDTFQSEYRMITADGSVVWFRDEAVIVKDGGGKNLFLQGVMFDITKRKLAEQQLEQIKRELEERVWQRTMELEHRNIQLRSLAAELSLAEEKTRRQIAIDVHDHIGQNLAIGKLKLQALTESSLSRKDKRLVNEVSDLITQTIEIARSLTFEISSPVLYELGLEPAIEWLLRNSRKRDGLITQFSTDGQPKRLSENVNVFLFQAVRELLVNVAKHAGARNVDVTVKRANGEIQICVADDGAGFDLKQLDFREQQEVGFGLFSIRERISHIGGGMIIESKPDCGTKITLVGPLADDEHSDRGDK